MFNGEIEKARDVLRSSISLSREKLQRRKLLFRRPGDHKQPIGVEIFENTLEDIDWKDYLNTEHESGLETIFRKP